MIVLLEPTKPAGQVSGGYRYNERIDDALMARRAIAPEALDRVIADLRCDPATSMIVVDGLFVSLRNRALPTGVVALWHMAPDRGTWSDAPLHAIVTSAATAEAIAPDCRSVATVRPGLDACFANVRNAHRPSEHVRVICCGAICEAKGQPRLARLLQRVDAPWQLRLIGNAQDDGSLPHAPRIEAVGTCTPADVAQHYADSDLFVSLSRSESFGMAAAEAAAAGLPVLALDTGEIGTFFEDGKSGWLLPIDASDPQLEESLRELVTMPTLLADARAANTPPPVSDWATTSRRFRDACEAIRAAGIE